MNKINYQKILDKILENIKKDNVRPKLLVHSCCAPCSSYVLEYLNDYFDITVLYYNPNISPKEEYEKPFEREAELIEKSQRLSQINASLELDRKDDSGEAVA